MALEYRVARSWFYYDKVFYQEEEPFKIYEYHILEIDKEGTILRICLLKSMGRAYLEGEWEEPWFPEKTHISQLRKLEEWDVGKPLSPERVFTYLL
jgi:hypothetical protein